MARHASKHPTELELEILKALWREQPLTVRDVREAISDFRDLAHTSVITVMNIMVDKGYLKRAKRNGRYVYTPRVTQEKTTRTMLGDVVDRLFDGSAATAVVKLLESGDMNGDELKELRALIDRKRKEGAS